MRRARWVPFADQVMANASNSLFMLLVAGEASPSAFGRFAVGYSVIAFAVGMWRSGLGYQVSLKAGDPLGLREESDRAIAATLMTSPVLAVAVLLVAGIGSDANPALAWGLALATPFVLAQDLLRYSAVAANKASLAFVSDAAWTALLVVAVLLRVLGQLDVVELILLWASGAVVATAILVLALRIAPRPAGTRAWISESWRGRTHIVSGGVISGVSVPITAAIAALVAGPAVAGGIAGAGVLMAPVNSLVAWLSLTLLAGAAILPDTKKRRVFARAGIATAAVTVVWGFALLLVPDWVGEILLGPTWVNTTEAVPIVGLQYALGVLASTGTLLLVSLNRTREVMSSGLAAAIARVCLGWSAAATVATVLSAALAETLAMGVWLAAVVRYLQPHVTRTQSRTSEEPADGPSHRG